MGRTKKIKDVISYFGPSTALEGDIHSDGSIHIDGKLKGSILCNGDLVIGEHSKVYGSIKARNITIHGYFKGTLESKDHLEICETGQVEGDIMGSQMSIREGGIYKGKVSVDVIQSQSIYEGAFQIIPS